MPTPAFPILNFDEARLSPSLGYVFDPRWLDPYESAVSMLWKFVAMNGLPGHVVIGHIAKLPVDPYEGIAATPAEVDIRHMARSLRVPVKTVRSALRHAGWQHDWCSELRFCTRCMARGYHGIVHQFGSTLQCPVHGCWLETECRGCGAASAFRIDARTLDAPFRCPQCRRPYATPTSTSFVHRRPFELRDRTAITRRFLRLSRGSQAPFPRVLRSDAFICLRSSEVRR